MINFNAYYVPQLPGIRTIGPKMFLELICNLLRDTWRRTVLGIENGIENGKGNARENERRSNKRNRKVRFNTTVNAILIPTIAEYKEAGVYTLIWNTPAEMEQYRWRGRSAASLYECQASTQCIGDICRPL